MHHNNDEKYQHKIFTKIVMGGFDTKISFYYSKLYMTMTHQIKHEQAPFSHKIQTNLIHDRSVYMIT